MAVIQGQRPIRVYGTCPPTRAVMPELRVPCSRLGRIRVCRGVLNTPHRASSRLVALYDRETALATSSMVIPSQYSRTASSFSSSVQAPWSQRPSQARSAAFRLTTMRLAGFIVEEISVSVKNDLV